MGMFQIGRFVGSNSTQLDQRESERTEDGDGRHVAG